MTGLQMDPRIQAGRLLILFGILVVIAGVIVIFADRIPYIGRLPGDINIRGKGWSVHFPIVSTLILSIILTLILNLFFRR